MTIKSRKINKNSILKTKKRVNMYKKLISQIGGASNYKMMFARDEYKNNFNIMFNNLVLYKHERNKTFKKKTSDIDKHIMDKLNNLMTIMDNNNEVDLTFINEVYSFPYLDVAGFFAIEKTKNDDGTIEYKFINDNDQLIYNITKTISVGTGAGDILLLTKKQNIQDIADYPDELVLKIYNKKPIIIEKNQKPYSSIGEGKLDFITKSSISNYGYKDYTAYSSMNIFNISKSSKNTYQGNFNDISFDTFINNNKAFDLNSHNCLLEKYNNEASESSDEESHSATSNIKEEIPINKEDLDKIKDKNKNYLYLACSYDDFINEYIQQIIMKNIISKYDDNINKSITIIQKLMKRTNTNYINNIMNFYNSIIIPVKEGSTINYYGCLVMEKVDGNLRNFLQLEEMDNKQKLTNIIKCIDDINNILKILKNPNNCFCHTDLKLENVFYKKLDDNNYKFILADYDKSSITYNKIRFYNSKFDFKARSYEYMFVNAYRIDKDANTYTIIRPELAKNPSFEKVEPEQLFLRYNPFPTIMKLDINIFLTSLFFNDLPIFAFLTDIIINNNSPNITNDKIKLFKKCKTISNIDKKYASYLRKQYSTSIKHDYSTYNGDFGKLIFYTNILNASYFDYKYNLTNFYNSKCINISLLTDNNKLIISNGLSKLKTDRQSSAIFDRSTSYTDEEKKVSILFTGNYTSKDSKIYFKTNRYTSQGGNILTKATSGFAAALAKTAGIPASSSLLYEWDYCKDLENEKSYTKFWELVKASVK